MYWARFFKGADGCFTVDVPDLPGCVTRGRTVEEAYNYLVSQAIPLWLEDQPWPGASGADEVLAATRGEGAPPPLLVRICVDDVVGLPAKFRLFWPTDPYRVKRRDIGH